METTDSVFWLYVLGFFRFGLGVIFVLGYCFGVCIMQKNERCIPLLRFGVFGLGSCLGFHRLPEAQSCIWVLRVWVFRFEGKGFFCGGVRWWEVWRGARVLSTPRGVVLGDGVVGPHGVYSLLPFADS